jgi:pimeloyl-ACP methyl ester carboxylesterase
MRSLRAHVLFVASLTVAAVAPATSVGRPGVSPVACPVQQWEMGEAAFEALPGAKAFFGQYEGGIYRIEIPDKWNGELMLSAHGFVSNAGPQGSRLRVGNPAIRQHLIDGGFAWAASSYRCNGYVPGVGLQDTMALTDLFTRFNNGTAPRRVYLTGTSMGGHVTLLGMHEFPTTFAGGLAMCPAGPELFDFFTATAAAAEAITGVELKQVGTLQQDIARMNEVLGTPPNVTEKGRQLASVQIHLSGGPRPFAVEGLGGRFTSNITSGAAALAGGTSVSNRAVQTTHISYALDEGLGLSAETLNKIVRRKSADPSVRSASGPHDELVPFDGRLERPVLSMHGTGDLFVPIHLQRILRRAVAAAGKDELLVQRVYRIAGHCQFSVAEQAKAFDDLVKWVRDGVKPEGDDVMGDLSDAGRRFTNPLRDGDPGTRRVEISR